MNKPMVYTFFLITTSFLSVYSDTHFNTYRNKHIQYYIAVQYLQVLTVNVIRMLQNMIHKQNTNADGTLFFPSALLIHQDVDYTPRKEDRLA